MKKRSIRNKKKGGQMLFQEGSKDKGPVAGDHMENWREMLKGLVGESSFYLYRS